MNRITFAIAATLSAILLATHLDVIGFLTAVAWGVHLYGAHDYLTDAFHEAHADTAIAAAGVVLAIFLTVIVDHWLFGLMGVASALAVLGLRKTLPQRFPE